MKYFLLPFPLKKQHTLILEVKDKLHALSMKSRERIHQPFFPVSYLSISMVKLLNILQDMHNNIQDRLNGLVNY